jgi:hypothetical protein
VDPDPTFQFNADPAPDPTTHFFPDLDLPKLQNDPLRLPPFHFDADPDPAFHFDADRDPAFLFDADSDQASQNDAEPCGFATLILGLNKTLGWFLLFQGCFSNELF